MTDRGRRVLLAIVLGEFVVFGLAWILGGSDAVYSAILWAMLGLYALLGVLTILALAFPNHARRVLDHLIPPPEDP